MVVNLVVDGHTKTKSQENSPKNTKNNLPKTKRILQQKYNLRGSGFHI